MRTMTFSRYRKLVAKWSERPPQYVLLAHLACANGYKMPTPPPTSRSLREQAEQLKAMFPSGQIKGASGG